MINITIYSKSGDNGWHDPNGCDCKLTEVKMDCLPVIGQILTIYEKDSTMKYLVKEVETILSGEQCFHLVYVYILNESGCDFRGR